MDDSEFGPFQGLLAASGVIWRCEHDKRDGVVDARRGKGLGYACRCNPSKLRLAVEKALMHDSARQREFVEVSISIGDTEQGNLVFIDVQHTLLLLFVVFKYQRTPSTSQCALGC